MTNEIIKVLNKNKSVIENAINLDNKRMQYDLTFDDLLGVCIKLRNKNYQINKSETVKTSIVIYNGNPKITLELALTALLYRLNFIFTINDDFLAINSILISIIERIIKQTKMSNFIKLYNNVLIAELSKTENLADNIIYIGDKFNYQNIKKYTSLPVIYNGYGEVIVYTDDEESFKEELNKIQEYAFQNDITINFYNGNIDKDMELINYDVQNDTCVIFSEDNEKIEKFKNTVNSKKVFINESPFENYEFEFDINKLI